LYPLPKTDWNGFLCPGRHSEISNVSSGDDLRHSTTLAIVVNRLSETFVRNAGRLGCDRHTGIHYQRLALSMTRLGSILKCTSMRQRGAPDSHTRRQPIRAYCSDLLCSALVHRRRKMQMQFDLCHGQNLHVASIMRHERSSYTQ